MKRTGIVAVATFAACADAEPWGRGDHVLERLPEGERRILEFLIGHYLIGLETALGANGSLARDPLTWTQSCTTRRPSKELYASRAPLASGTLAPTPMKTFCRLDGTTAGILAAVDSMPSGLRVLHGRLISYLKKNG